MFSSNKKQNYSPSIQFQLLQPGTSYSLRKFCWILLMSLLFVINVMYVLRVSPPQVIWRNIRIQFMTVLSSLGNIFYCNILRCIFVLTVITLFNISIIWTDTLKHMMKLILTVKSVMLHIQQKKVNKIFEGSNYKVKDVTNPT